MCMPWDRTLSMQGHQTPVLCRGYNIGIRLIDEFLAKSKTGKCIDFRDTADKIAKVSSTPDDAESQKFCVSLRLTFCMAGGTSMVQNKH